MPRIQLEEAETMNHSEVVKFHVFLVVVASHVHGVLVTAFIVFHLLNCLFYQILLVDHLEKKIDI